MNQPNQDSNGAPPAPEPTLESDSVKQKKVSFSAHKSRWLTGLPLFVAVAAAVLWGPLWLLAVILALGAVLALGELEGLLKTGPFGLEAAAGRIMGAVIMGLACWGAAPAWGALGVSLALTALLVLALGDEPKDMCESLIKRSFGFLYCVLPLASLLLLAELPQGRLLVLFVIASVAAADVGAYYAGHSWGKKKLAPRLSPGKTWEGFGGGMVLACLLGALCGFSGWFGQGVWQMALAALVLAGLSVLGDLLESVFKRSAGVKDAGNLLPGHGGILDRIDGLIAAAPAMYLMKVLWWL